MLDRIISMQDAIEKLRDCRDEQSFRDVIYQLKVYMKEFGYADEVIREVEKRSFYLPNAYSDKDMREKIEDAKKRVMEYIFDLTDQAGNDDILLAVLENYYLFLEGLFEREPHKRGGIQKSQLDSIRIKNEYDVQHFLYAYLKPLYPQARIEVSEDTGYNTVRSDIFLDPDRVIEIKCSRDNMTFKKLAEEIEADIVHYSASKIYFFIYDKEKIIENPINFKCSIEKKMREKEIHVIIHQPKIL